MDRYIDSLIKELNIKTYIPNAEDWLAFICNYEEFSDSIDFCKPLSHILNIEKGKLPTYDKLTKKQLKKIILEVSKALKKLHIYLEYPSKTPIKLQYKLMRDLWDQDLYFYPHMNTHIDFCEGNCESCELLLYCDVGRDLNIISEF